MDPITITGRIELKDYQRAAALVPSSSWITRPWLLTAITGVAGAIMGLAGGINREHPGGWAVVSKALVIGAFAAGLVYSFCAYFMWQTRRRLRRVYDQQKGLREEFTADLSEEGWHSRTATGESRVPWDFFHKWVSADDMVLLFASDTLMTMVPRRAFASQEDFDALREVLARKIGPAGKPRAAGPVASEAAPEPPPGPPLAITCRIEFEDYERAQELSLGAPRSRRRAWWMLVGLLVASWAFRGLVHWFDPVRNDLTPTVWDYLLVAIIVLWPAIAPLLKRLGRRGPRRVYDQHRSFQQEFTAEFTEEGWHSRSATGESRLPWDYFHKWISADDMVLLFESDVLMHVVPRRAFPSEAGWQAFRDLVTRKLGPAGK